MATKYLCTFMFLIINLVGVFAVDYENNTSIERFREYVQINTTTNNDLTPAVDFWKTQALALNLSIDVLEFMSGYPVVVIRWPGSDSTLGSIMLNSHMDVVSTAEEDWTYPPFSAYLDDEGWIWGRGTQDMKSVGIQYYEALKRMKENNEVLLRDVYMTLMPDEETSGINGMQKFLVSDEFAAMNVSCEMDEGSAYPAEQYPFFYRDKDVWQIQVDCYGEGGHSSTFQANNVTATGKCRKVIDSLLDYREEQYEVAVQATIMNGTYTSINLNIMDAGTANNIIPDHVQLIFDIRLSTTLNLTEFADQLQGYVTDAGENVTLTYIVKNERSPATIINSTNPYWEAVSQAFQDANITAIPVVSPASTDARYVRAQGIPAFGFSPEHNTPLLLHSVNERLNAEVFLEGIDIYELIIRNLANIPESSLTPGMSYVTY